MGLVGAVFALAILFVVSLWSRPLLGAENETRNRVRQVILLRFRLVLQALPLSAFKIVVVVLQIITQVSASPRTIYIFLCSAGRQQNVPGGFLLIWVAYEKASQGNLLVHLIPSTPSNGTRITLHC